MRRITLALALAGAVIATGCSGGASSTTGGNPGVADGTFTLTIQNGQDGNTSLAITNGYVTSSPAGIDCGVAPRTACSATFPTAASVVLTATPDVGFVFLGWAGDCVGDQGEDAGTCTLTGAADKYVVARFGTTEDIAIHGNFSSPAKHGPEYMAFYQQPAPDPMDPGVKINGVWQCTKCHGTSLQGVGIAVSCALCHGDVPVPGEGPLAAGTAIGKHFEASGHNSGGCARCHTGDGFKAYIGQGGATDPFLSGYTAANPANAAAITPPTPNTWNGMKCDMCHNSVAASLTQVLLPQQTGAGKVFVVDSVSALCGQCHTGVRDGRNIASVGAKLATAPADQDAQLTTGNSAVRPHYVGAMATFLGGEAAPYAQITGAIYTGRNEHGGLDGCTDCHNAHTGGLPRDSDVRAKCGSCHFNEAGAMVNSFLELEETRQFGFEGDIDGDLDATESLKDEIAGLADKLYAALKAYGTQVPGAADICFAFEGDGQVDQPYVQVNTTDECGEGANATAYNTFTARSLRAAFNFSAIKNDPGAWAHNPRYAIEILYDSIADLNQGIGLKNATPTFAEFGFRAFKGHFGSVDLHYASMLYHGATNNFTDELIPQMGFTSGACYQCHGGTVGMAEYFAAPTAPAWPASNGTSTPFKAYWVDSLQCSVCHTFNGEDMRGTRTDITSLNFPGQKAAGQFTAIDGATFFPNAADRACATCHSGREGTLSINAYIATLPGGEDAGWVGGFKNPHYLGAAGVLLGSNAQMMYEFPGKTYTANPPHFGSPHGSLHGSSCVGCHEPKGTAHTFEITAADMEPGTGKCGVCHAPTAHGDFTLSLIEEEFVTLVKELETAIVNYSAAAVADAKPGANRVCYKENHPYFTVDSVEPYEFLCQAADSGTPKMDPALIRAAGNYKWAKAEPGAWAHNTEYALEILYDSIVALGGTPSIKPATR